MSDSIVEGFRGRRSIYALANESTIPDERIEELISEVVKNTPSAFHSQSTRVVVLLKEEHQKV